jgi:hypothetical protein
LRVINRVHTQLQLRLIWIPTRPANQEVVVLGLDNLFAQLRKFEPECATVALGNRILA